MSIAPLATAAPSSAGNSARTELSERIETTKNRADSTLANMATAAVDGVSATVSFSGKALHALEHAGEMVVDGAESLAVGAWHGLQAVEHAGEAIATAVEDGAHEVVSTAKAAATELGHYAAIGLHAGGEAVSEVASGGVMAASAVGKTVMALV